MSPTSTAAVTFAGFKAEAILGVVIFVVVAAAVAAVVLFVAVLAAVVFVAAAVDVTDAKFAAVA